MTIYLDASALMKRYVEEPDSEASERILHSDHDWVTGRHTYVEVRRNISRLVTGAAYVRAKAAFELDWLRTSVVELDPATCEAAAEIAESSGLRTLDA